MKFLCDEMLKGLSRWLRAAGYDAAQAEPSHRDRELVEQAHTQGRTLLTRDRKILEIKHAKNCTLLLHGNSLESWVCQLNQDLNINWHHDPFTRCLLCNHKLQQAERGMLEKIPPEAIRADETILFCSECNKLYWAGSHVKRMRRMLEHWSTHCVTSS